MILQQSQMNEMCFKYYKYQQQFNLNKDRGPRRRAERVVDSVPRGVWKGAAGAPLQSPKPWAVLA